MRVRWLSKALHNLSDEAAHIAQDDPAMVAIVVRRVLDAVSALSDQPGLGRPGRVHGTRELLIPRTRYIVPYRVNGDVVEVLRAFHTSRRLPLRW